jgi:diamine N-acetyltransferase
MAEAENQKPPADLAQRMNVGMELEGPRVTIRPMKREDLDAMMEWRPFADPLYQPFDFPHQNRTQHIRWFEWRSQDPSRRLYTIEDQDHGVIGSLTLREINRRQSARLGITIGADFVSQGYGTEALRLFLDHFFGEMGFSQVVLDVAATNLRAVRCYRTIGFRQVGQHYRPASAPSYRTLQIEPRYRHLRRFFRRQGTTTQVLFYDMVLTREEWHTLSRTSEPQCELERTTSPISPSCSSQSGHAQGPR